MNRLRDESGIALITVLFVGAALTAVGSAAAFVAVNEMRANLDDRRGSESLAYAEAGIDRLSNDIKAGRYNTAQILFSGCEATLGADTIEVAGDVGDGTYTATLGVYPDETMDGGAECNNRAADPSYRLFEPRRFAITSVGTHPTARRVVRMLVDIRVRGLPLAVYANSVTGGGTPKISEISLFTPGTVANREQIGFRGQDNVYRIGDFWCYPLERTDPACTVPNKDDFAPSAVHAGGTAECTTPSRCPLPPRPREHSVDFPLNCIANRTGANAGVAGQSQWDQTGDGGPIGAPACSNWRPDLDPLMPDHLVGPPPNSAFSEDQLASLVPEPNLADEDYLQLRDSAQTNGIYCHIDAAQNDTCTRDGQPWNLPSVIQEGDLELPTPLPNNLIVYFEYEDATQRLGANEVHWSASWPTDGTLCNPNVPPEDRKTIIIVVRNGSFQGEANTRINGAMFLPEGRLRDAGGFIFNGPIIADIFDRSGQSEYRLDECWLGGMPSPFITLTAVRWQEIDR